MFNLKSLDITALVLLGILIICFMTNNLSLINNDGIVNKNVNVPNKAPSNNPPNRNRTPTKSNNSSNNTTTVAAYTDEEEGAPINIRQSCGLDGYAKINSEKLSNVVTSTDLKPVSSGPPVWDQPYDLNKLNDINLVTGTRYQTSNNTLRNSSLDIRGDITNPKVSVSPWLISTIEPNNFPNKLCV